MSEIRSQISELEEARARFRREALAAKTGGDRQTALQMVKAIKTCEALLQEVRQGNTVDLAPIRQAPAAAPVQVYIAIKCERLLIYHFQVEVAAAAEQPRETPQAELEAPTEGPPVTIMDSLMERLEKYRQEETKATEAGNDSKARRMGRIRKQYEEAVKLHKAGRPIPRSDLPDPPGFAPIPVSDPPGLSKPPAPQPQPQSQPQS